MSRTLQPAGLSRVFSIGWLMSLGFTKGRVGAVLAYPLCLLTVAVYAPRGQVYESPDRDGMVIFGRYRLWVELVAGALIFVAGTLIAFSLIPVVGPATVGVVAVFFSLLLWLGIAQMGSAAMAGTPVGSETPKGDRWQTAALAQRPGTRFSALLLTRQLIDSLPTGDIAVAAAADDRLLHAYEKFGFTAGKSRRVYRVAS